MNLNKDLRYVRRRSWAALAFSILSATLARAEANNELHFSARAFALDSGQLAYTEQHVYTREGLYSVTYREPNGTPFATKTADFSIARFAPDVEQHNQRLGEVVRITRRNASTVNAAYREREGKTLHASDIAITADTVIDAGFHPYVLAQWDELVRGNVKHIDYVVPSWRRSVTLAVAAIPCARSGQQCFRIKPANSLVAVFAHAVELSYDPESRQLLEFRGTSNIARSDGEFQRVRIVYDYDPTVAASH